MKIIISFILCFMHSKMNGMEQSHNCFSTMVPDVHKKIILLSLTHAQGEEKILEKFPEMIAHLKRVNKKWYGILNNPGTHTTLIDDLHHSFSMPPSLTSCLIGTPIAQEWLRAKKNVPCTRNIKIIFKEMNFSHSTVNALSYFLKRGGKLPLTPQLALPDGSTISTEYANHNKTTLFSLRNITAHNEINYDFANDGFATVDFKCLKSKSTAVCILSDKTYIVAGYVADNKIALARFNQTGEQDFAFGKMGSITTSLPIAMHVFPEGIHVKKNDDIIVYGHFKTVEDGLDNKKHIFFLPSDKSGTIKTLYSFRCEIDQNRTAKSFLN